MSVLLIPESLSFHDAQKGVHFNNGRSHSWHLVSCGEATLIVYEHDSEPTTIYERHRLFYRGPLVLYTVTLDDPASDATTVYSIQDLRNSILQPLDDRASDANFFHCINENFQYDHHFLLNVFSCSLIPFNSSRRAFSP
jgi:hypothetical protein